MLRLPIVLCLVALLPALGHAADEEAHPTLRGFYATGSLDLVVAERIEAAEILFSQSAAAYLIRPAAGKDTYLLLQRKRTVSKVTAALLRRTDGDVDLPKDPKLQPIGTFEPKDGRIVIDAGSLKGHLRARAPLTGAKGADDVRTHSPQYGLVARAFRPDKAAIQRLQKAKDVKVEVIFGSWCPRCQQTIGNALRIDTELAGAGAAFIFYGLPAPPAAWKDKGFLQSKAKALPTALVYVGDRMVGRVPPGDWKRLDVAIAGMLKK